MNIALLTNFLNPYRVPLFNGLQADPNIDLSVLLLGNGSPDHPSWSADTPRVEFGYEYLDGGEQGLKMLSLRSLTSAGRLGRRLWRWLDRNSPDVIVLGGYAYLALWIALAWAKLHRVPVVLWVGSHSKSLRRRQRPWRTAFKRWFVRRASAAVCYGSRSAAYLRELGLESEKVLTGCNPVDNDYFARQASVRRARRSVERNRLGIADDEPLLIYVGRLAPEKRLDVLLDALAMAPNDNLRLVLVGDGPSRGALETQLEALSLSDRVTFVGWKGRDQLPMYYSMADMLVLPSDLEEWGLVVNEALATGLWVLVSDRCGCAYDLVLPGVNGFRFRAGEPADLSDKIAASIEIRKAGVDHAAIGASISRCSPNVLVQCFVSALKIATDPRR